MENVRTRLERQQFKEREERSRAQAPKPKPTQQTNEERAERLSRNAEQIRNEQVAELLVDISPDERFVVFTLIGSERPASLGNSDVISMTLERVRIVGTANLREVMRGATEKEKEEVWNILREGDAFARTGMDGGAACRAALYQVRET